MDYTVHSCSENPLSLIHMKKAIVSLMFFLTCISISAKQDIDSLLKILDEKISNNNVYIELKESKIEELKLEKRQPNISSSKQYSLNNALFKEYKPYMSDSAIYYLNQNLDIAYSLNDQYKINETNIASALLFSRLGMYKEGLDLLLKVKIEHLDLQMKVDYYLAYRELYLGLGSYTQDNRERDNYWKKTALYRDSLKNIMRTESEEYLRIIEHSLRENNMIDEALRINDKRLVQIRPNTPAYALVTFHRSLLYRRLGDTQNEKIYLALSAISDIQLAIKDNASIPILANILMHEGDINRAYNYVRFSLENISDYNTRVRSSEILNIQRIIDKEYQTRNDKKNKELRSFLIITSILSILLVISVIYVYKEMKRGVSTSRKLKEINQELNILNQKLHNMNSELKKRNFEVAEANHIKEEYIGYFLDECSKYIDKLDNYRKMVNKNIQDRQYESLYKITKDNTLKEVESKELFSNFDTMFIHLFPDFVEKLNLLLLDEEQIVLKKGEFLNTELRIYALIRLGIDDSSKIANFLGYSVNTIYNYRAKIKNKAKISRENFEWTVKNIGTFIK